MFWIRTAPIALLIIVNYFVFMRSTAKVDLPVETRLHALLEVKDSEQPQDPIDKEQSGKMLIAGKFKRGESFFSIFKKNNLDARVAGNLFSSLGNVLNIQKIPVGTKYKIFTDEEGGVEKLEIETSPFNVFVAQKQELGVESYDSFKKQVDKVQKVVAFGCKVTGTLEDSMIRCKGDKHLVSKVINLMTDNFNFYTDLHFGDEVKLIIEKQFINNKFIAYGKILALQYAGAKKTVDAFYYESPEGDWDYYDAQGDSTKRQFLRYPLKYKRVSSGFTHKRMHPVLHKYKKHLAIDFAAPVGTPVRAYSGGTVVYAGKSGASGNLIILKHKNRYKTYYAHLNKFKKKIKHGVHVKKGDIIGYVGKTGRATGPHLHFVLKKGKKFLNPFKVANPPLYTLPDNLKMHFKKVVKDYLEKLEKIDVESSGFKKT